MPIAGGGADIFKAMDDDVCQAIILDNDGWDAARGGLFSLPQDDPRYAAHPGGAARYHCDTKVLLPAAVYNTEIALPVRSDLQNSLSWATTIAKDVGTWQSDDEQARRLFLPPPACSAQEADQGPPSLDFWSGAGIMILSAFANTLGLFLNFMYRALPSQRAQRRAWRKQVEAYEAATAMVSAHRVPLDSVASLTTDGSKST